MNEVDVALVPIDEEEPVTFGVPSCVPQIFQSNPDTHSERVIIEKVSNSLEADLVVDSCQCESLLDA